MEKRKLIAEPEKKIEHEKKTKKSNLTKN